MADRSKRKLFSNFYDEHIQSVYRFVYLKIGSKEDSEDITSEAFTRLWEQIKSPTEIENPRAYIFQVARNLVIDHYRKKRLIKLPHDEVEVESERKTPEEAASLSVEGQRLAKAMVELKDSYQNVLIFYYLEKMPIKEIARIEGKSKNAVRVTIHRALNSLRDILEKEV